MQVEVSSTVLDALLAEAGGAAPRECCGLLMGEGERITAIEPAANIHPEPARHFEIDPQALVNAHRAARQGGPQVVGYYHSHPSSAPEPSATDRAMALRDGSVWAIIGQGRVTLWRDCENGFEELSYHLHGG